MVSTPLSPPFSKNLLLGFLPFSCCISILVYKITSLLTTTSLLDVLLVGQISILFMCICGVSAFMGLFNYIHRLSVGVLNEPPKPNEAMTSLLNAMKNEQESTQSLLAAAMILAVTEPENPSILTLVNALKERYATAPSI
ncbi:hypothetical protein AtEden1_Chr2g0223471 [Arabidopsis thaliana]